MRKFFLKPGFEFIFSLGLIVIIALPPVLLAQTQKDIEIKIENGDTTVNGKNIKELPANDRQSAVRDIKHLNSLNAGSTYVFKRKDTTDNKIERFGLKRSAQGNVGHQRMITENIIIKDSLGNIVGVKPIGLRPHGLKMELSERDFPGRLSTAIKPLERKNSQNFDFVSTDNDGVSTRVVFRVSDISNDDLKKMPRVEGGKFEISDLNLVPEFSTGKTLLMFNLPAKTVAGVKLIDNQGKIAWNEKANGGSFSKTFVIGLNGTYYLQIKQGSNIAVKKITKEE
ncbi:MAG TPA: T9SS type A sorting domain-containing protein [Mucilaginibacter sp.]